jgi:hypothetical protein
MDHREHRMIDKFKLSLYAYDVKPLPFVEQLWRDAYVFNAPRPLAGNISGEGEWHCGIYYAVVNPSSEYAQQDIKTNLSLAAVLLVPATMEQIIRLGEMMIPEKYRADYDKLRLDNQIEAATYHTQKFVNENTYQTVMEAIRG